MGEKIVSIPGLDLKTFNVVSVGIVKDSKNVYFTTQGPKALGTGPYAILKEADAATFVVDKDGIPKDKNHVFTWRKDHFAILEGADPVTIKKIGTACNDLEYSKDKNNVYIDLEQTTVDAKSFIYYNSFTGTRYSPISSYAKDKKYVYLCGKPNKDIDVATFKVLKPETPDAKYVDILGQSLDVGSEYLVWNETPISYAKDKNHLYMNGNVANNFKFDSETFTQLYNSYTGVYFKDKNNVYKHVTQVNVSEEASGGPEIIEGLDPATIRPISNSWSYFKDKNSVYMSGGKMDGADPATFEWIKTKRVAYDKLWMKDKNHIYLEGKVIEGADLATFYVVQVAPETINFEGKDIRKNESGYAFNIGKDKNHVYDESGKAVPGLIPTDCTIVLPRKCFLKPPVLYTDFGP